MESQFTKSGQSGHNGVMVDLNTVNLNRLLTFVAVVDAGSLTAAAGRLGLAKSMVSKHMQLLEAEIGVTLLLRSTRKLSLTEAGRAFCEASRVASPIDYGVIVVAPLLAQLQARYPLLKIDLTCGDHVIDLIAEGIDVTVRLGKLADSGHMAARVGPLRRWLVASPEFIAQHGMPDSPEVLETLPFIALSVLPQPSLFTMVGKEGRLREARMRNIVFSTNTAYASRAAALAGVGVLRATTFLTQEDVDAGRLVRLMPDWSLEESNIHAVFPASPHLPQKVRVFIDALKAAAGG
jgi:DNA-binding transcriptional LysR family regulator